VNLSTIVTIDGPAGSGKSTVAEELARRLEYIHLNSGVMYRAVARAALDHNIDLDNRQVLMELANSAEFDFHLNSSDFRTRVEVLFSHLPDYDICLSKVYDEDCSSAASTLAVIAEVREILTAKQRVLGRRENMVLEGRDAGTVVFPGADFKFYLETSLDERVWRRVSQQSGLQRDDPSAKEKFLEMKRQILERDDRDSSREASPLRVPEGAHVVVTDNLSVDEVVEHLSRIINAEAI
jgi:cytidylate kinase